MKRFIDIYVPVTRCNLHCHYCYVPQLKLRDSEEMPFIYSAGHIGKALSSKRLGGICHFNMCGLGETLIPELVIDIVRAILEQGHYVMIVTNGLLTKRFEQFMEFPEEYRRRLGFKFSFHYLELKSKGLMERFFYNIDMVRGTGFSFSLELTPSDELEPYIDEVKAVCLDRVGAYCHVTIPRDMTKEDIVLLSRHSFDDFCKVWSVFDSEMFDFKAGLWGEKRTEFCYAGVWSGLLNIGNGILSQCYCSYGVQNILKNPNKKITFRPVGNVCSMPHCYNSHSLLGLGCIPSIKGNYALERDRIDKRDGSHWLNDDMRSFLSERLEDDNVCYSGISQKCCNLYNRAYLMLARLKRKWMK